MAAGYAILLAALIVWGATRRTASAHFAELLSVIIAFVGFITYAFGCAALAEAKGYSTSVAIGIIFVCLCCCSIGAPIIPTIVLLVLEDKSDDHQIQSRLSRRWR